MRVHTLEDLPPSSISPNKRKQTCPFLSAFLPFFPCGGHSEGHSLGLACEKSAVSLDWTGFSLPPLPFPQRPALPTGRVGAQSGEMV